MGRCCSRSLGTETSQSLESLDEGQEPVLCLHFFAKTFQEEEALQTSSSRCIAIEGTSTSLPRPFDTLSSLFPGPTLLSCSEAL